VATVAGGAPQGQKGRAREFTSPPDPLPRRGKLLLGDPSAATPVSGTSGPRRGTHACGQFPGCRLRRGALRPGVNANSRAAP